MRILAVLLVLTATSTAIAQVDAPKRQGKTMPEWLEQLSAADAKARVRACEALGDFGRHGTAAVGPLAKRLTDDSGDVRFAAADALRRIGPPAKDVVPPLLKVVKEDDDKSVRIAAIKALGGIGPQAKAAVPALVAAAIAEREREGEAGGEGAGQVAAAVVDALGGIGVANKETKDLLARTIKHSRPALRIAALRTWAEIGADADRDMLIPALSDKSSEIKFAALEAWGRGGTSTPASLKAAIGLLAEADVELRRAAVSQLASGPLAAVEPAIADAVRARLTDADGLVRVAAVLGLAKRIESSEFGPVCTIEDQAYAVLLAALKDNDPLVRSAAASALRYFGQREEQQTIEVLNPMLEDASLAVRRAAATTLLTCKTDDPKAASVLGSQLLHHDINVRSEAALAFCTIGTRAKSMLPEFLIKMEQDVSPVVRQHAARALGILAQGVEESEHKHIIAELTAAADKDPMPMVRVAAAVAMVQARAPSPTTAITMLRQGLGDADPEIRLATLRMVAASSNFPKELVAAVEDLLDESSPEMRRLAASVLRRKE